MPHPNHVPARRFMEAFFAGKLTDEYLTDDMAVWTTLGPIADRSIYAPTVNMIMAVFQQEGASFEYTIDAITAEDDRVVLEVHARGVFPDGVDYANTYVFVLRMRDGRVASICEHFNPLPAMEKLFPRLNMNVG
jgi:ketosteroid isomerase-like protein